MGYSDENSPRLGANATRRVIDAFRSFCPDIEEAQKLQPVTRKIIHRLWQEMGKDVHAELELARCLEGTWGGEVLANMQAHYRDHIERLQRTKLEHEQNRRERETRKHERIKARAVTKRDQDRIWWQQHGCEPK
ncbi:MAG: hypothetical protein AMXMBFR84_16760 [Candidatus Hydrogenedentota bacterium]